MQSHLRLSTLKQSAIPEISRLPFPYNLLLYRCLLPIHRAPAPVMGAARRPSIRVAAGRPASLSPAPLACFPKEARG